MYPFHKGSEEEVEALAEEEEVVLEGEAVFEGVIITVEIIMVEELPHAMKVVWEILLAYKNVNSKVEVDQLALLLEVSLDLVVCVDWQHFYVCLARIKDYVKIVALVSIIK